MRIKIPSLRLVAPPASTRNVLPARATDDMVWRDAEGRIVASSHRDGAEDLLQVPALALFRWNDQAAVVTAHPEPNASVAAIVDAFERGVLPLALQARGLQVLHASAVATPRGVVAFCARSQTGKSTIAYAWSQRCGDAVWADDVVAFDPHGDAAMAIPLPFTLKLRSPSVAHFGIEATGAPQPSAMGEPVQPLELVALFALERSKHSGDPLQTRRLPASRAFTALLEHAYCFDLEDRSRRRATIIHYLELSAKVPVFELRFPTGLETLPAVLDQVELALATSTDEATAKRSRP